MAYPDYSQLLLCPKCGNVGAIFVLKVAGLKIVIKQNCPQHGAHVIEFPFMQKDFLIPHLHDAIFRCFKCGQVSEQFSARIDGPWTILKLNCPIHGNKLPNQKIWSSMYIEIEGQLPIKQDFQQPELKQPEKIQLKQPESIQPKLEQPQSILANKKKFCSNCGSLLMGNEKFCGICGEELG